MRWLLRTVRGVQAIYWQRGLGCAVYRRTRYTENIRSRIVLSGVLSWFGLKQETEPENNLIITIKRGILAAQEGDLKRSDQIFHLALKMANDIGHGEGKTHLYTL